MAQLQRALFIHVLLVSLVCCWCADFSVIFYIFDDVTINTATKANLSDSALVFKNKTKEEKKALILKIDKFEDICKLTAGIRKISSFSWGKRHHVFQCCDQSASADVQGLCWSSWKAIKYVVNSDERNLPYEWENNKSVNHCLNKDGRSVALYPGMKGCMVYQSSEFRPGSSDADQSFAKEIEMQPMNGIFTKESDTCGYGFIWAPRYNATVDDNYCSFHFTLRKMWFLCCCYEDSSNCEIHPSQDKVVCPVQDIQLKISGDTDADKAVVLNTIKVSDMQPSSDCFIQARMVRGEYWWSDTKTADVDIKVSKEFSDECLNLDNDIESGCKLYQRVCYQDTDNTHLFCCSFNSETVAESENQGVLSFHEHLRSNLKYGFNRLKTNNDRCSGIYEYSDKYCVYFYDGVIKEFVNIRLNLTAKNMDPNFIVSNETYDRIKEMMNKAEAKDFTTDGIQIQGTLNSQSECKDNKYPNIAPFYHFTVLMIFCNSELNQERCDDFRKDPQASLKKISQLDEYRPKYKCHSGTSETLPLVDSWDNFCVSTLIESKPGKFTYKFEAANRKLAQHDKVGALKSADSTDEYYCTDSFESTEGIQRICFCSNRAGKEDKPCNTKQYIKMYHEVDALDLNG